MILCQSSTVKVRFFSLKQNRFWKIGGVCCQSTAPDESPFAARPSTHTHPMRKGRRSTHTTTNTTQEHHHRHHAAEAQVKSPTGAIGKRGGGSAAAAGSPGLGASRSLTAPSCAKRPRR